MPPTCNAGRPTLNSRRTASRIVQAAATTLVTTSESEPPASCAPRGDIDIEYFTQGLGESIVLLPFGGLTVGYMKELSNDLADAGYRVARINFRGPARLFRTPLHCLKKNGTFTVLLCSMIEITQDSFLGPSPRAALATMI